jgi:hypothetical protein
MSVTPSAKPARSALLSIDSWAIALAFLFVIVIVSGVLPFPPVPW